MAKFLNRDGIIDGVVNILREAQEEVIMVVPFIKISSTIYQEMMNAVERKVEILLIHRENSLNQVEKKKLYALSNLTVMNHPYVHTKCYLNKDSLIIASMNLYEPTERRNREMGIHLTSLSADSDTYQEALSEVKEIVISSAIEKSSDQVLNKGFRFKLLSPRGDYLKPIVDTINIIFVNKLFKIIETVNDPIIQCFPYHEKLSVSVGYEKSEIDSSIPITFKRLLVEFIRSEEEKEKLFELFWSDFNKKYYYKYQIFWDHHSTSLSIYPNKRKHPKWKTYTFEETIKEMKKGLDRLVKYIKIVENKI